MTISIIGATGHLGHALARRINDLKIDRKSVEQGKSVDLGRPRIIKKKKKDKMIDS